ncbi:arginine N-succinyltransferase [Silvimonas amylolytica]|uniref:Arginine N-succinyltransferase subunit beta n=1 Tax=Silvimonas amylolytica TaxID=449663 RepID=A0ABQ2PKW6_9NEIS|nr:arginine N-succinyltransferase [Silvimonas amylolytica]GGP25966.1 arginine N-succinyltransferase subunit beta [Silvimonas amylolytica]
MIVMRLCTPADLDALIDLANKAGPGMTTLKPDRDVQGARLDRVQRTVEGVAALADQGYLFMMEDTSTGAAVGVCGLEVAVGLEQPFYTYRMDTFVHASREMGLYTRMDKLHMSHGLTGYSELCTLFLSPDWRVNGNGALLSKSRFMFIAQFPARFSEHLCAEMRGHFDEHGESPFWRALGAHFYRIGFNEADQLVAQGKKSFLAELMPRYPVYVDFLPEDARACIGKTHIDTEPARRLLESEGLRAEQHIDIFEGGPVLEARIDSLRVMHDSALYTIEITDSPATSDTRWIVANSELADFRVMLTRSVPHNGVLPLTPEQAAALHVTAGSSVRAMTLNPAPR